MTEAVTRIVAQLNGLSQEERAELAQVVLRSLEPEESGAEEAWDDELGRRVARIRSGDAEGAPAEQVFADWQRPGRGSAERGGDSREKNHRSGRV
jgi:putative addiction module component (TIGR02574 family)